MKQKNYELTILVRDKEIVEYEHNGLNFIEGRKGSAFRLLFKNNTSKPVLAVPSIDGISTLNGQPATTESPGIKVNPFSKVELKGWVIDNNNCAEFVFFDKENGYSTYVSGNTKNTGVIGVLVFEEKVELSRVIHISPPRIQPYMKNDPWSRNYLGDITYSGDLKDSLTNINMVTSVHSTMAGAITSSTSKTTGLDANTKRVAAKTEDFSLGTGWGKQVEQKLVGTTFNKGDLSAQLTVYYDSRKNLERRGIVIKPQPRKYLDDLPQAFSGIGCKPPPGWKG